MVSQKRTVILVTHKLEYLPQSHHIVVMESGAIRHSDTYLDIETKDPSLVASWKKGQHREEEIRRKATIEECKTTKERHKLVRMLSNKVGCRASMPLVIPKTKTKRRHVSFNRLDIGKL